MLKWTNIWHSIFFKFSLAFLIVGMIPLLALSSLSLNQITDQVERHTENNFSQMVFYLSKNVDDILLNYNEISKNMYYNAERVPDRQGVTLKQEIDSLSQMNKIAMNDFLKTVLYSDPHIENTLFVRHSDGTVFSQSRTNKVLDQNEPFPSVSWSYTLSAKPKQLAVFPPHLETYFSSTRQVITFARNYIDTTGKLGPEAKVLGTLFFDVDLSIFDRLFRQVKLEGNDDMFVVDGNGYILYSNQEDKLGKRFDELSARNKGNMKVFSEPVPFMGGQVIGLVSKTDLYASLVSVRSTVFVVAAVCFLALIVLGALFSRSFTRPILDIMRLMVKVESGHLDHGLTIKRKDELGRLAHGFNRMIERLQSFINEAYVGEIKRKQTELNALKSQIRPHYLYNTLEVIRMSAVSNDDEEVADMIHSLSNQLQYVIDYGEEWVSVQRELKHLRHYFHLIEVRFDKRIELQVDLHEEELLQASILKLSLQPIVENAVLHGIRPRGGKGVVQVTIEKVNDNEMAVTVFDNGIGMDEGTVERLILHLAEAEGTSGKSIGVKNVHERLRQACGVPYGITIESKPNIGTAVRMLFPLRREGY
ncbi:cache domain-containing sensor histidine kinase [Paenibacillus luteus]|uniref:cache domain-containing sensor histidine kinase n=1 Tax=Paenibacillus luteus TaxID=2545753 RepID=UPI0011424AED|nr:sensor histidine kinase [Paenibacillus luteus]